MKYTYFAFFLYSLAFLSNSAMAEDVRYYDFEVIFFESLDRESRISEVWKSDITIEPPETFVTLGQPYPGPMPKEFNPKYTFKFLPKQSYRLDEEAKLLENSRNYRILLHTAWRQPGMSEGTALPIHFHKEFIGIKEPEIGSTTAAATGNTSGTFTTSGNTKSVLDGYLKIILSRYLHADFDFVYKTGVPVTTTNEVFTSRNNPEEAEGTESFSTPPIVTYHLKQTRKMRSKEIHYIDHPVLGAIILAWPVETKQ
jgi:hypothetical protein